MRSRRFRSEGDEHIHIQRGHRFQIEGRAHRVADGVAVNDAVGLHPIDGGDGFLDVHGFERGSIAISRRAFNRNSLGQA